MSFMGCYLMYFSLTANPLEIKLGIDLKQAATSERQRQFSNGFVVCLKVFGLVLFLQISFTEVKYFLGQLESTVENILAGTVVL